MAQSQAIGLSKVSKLKKLKKKTARLSAIFFNTKVYHLRDFNEGNRIIYSFFFFLQGDVAKVGGDKVYGILEKIP